MSLEGGGGGGEAERVGAEIDEVAGRGNEKEEEENLTR